jgi:hypothetical protein
VNNHPAYGWEIWSRRRAHRRTGVRLRVNWPRMGVLAGLLAFWLLAALTAWRLL